MVDMKQDKHQPIQDEYREKMNALAKGLDDIFNGNGPRKTGFCLLVFPFGEDPDKGRVNYVSNADRHDMIDMMKGLLKRWEVQALNEEMGNAATKNR
jgi:hypothetical protein